MGTVIRENCPRCGYRTEILTGGGLRDCWPETALSAAGEDPGLKAALKENCQFRIERFPAACAVCRKIVTAARVTYWTSDGGEHVVGAVCPDCGRPVEQSGGEILCPVCGHPLDQASVGHWD